MMKKFDYYTAPSQEVFDDIKYHAIKIWEGYDDTFGYRTEKLEQINKIKNISDNAWYIVGMFDSNNQEKLINSVIPEAKELIIQAIRGY